jgi:PAS domain S-box-containing protein
MSERFKYGDLNQLGDLKRFAKSFYSKAALQAVLYLYSQKRFPVGIRLIYKKMTTGESWQAFRQQAECLFCFAPRRIEMRKTGVLIVDDEIELCDKLKNILEAQWDNYHIFTAYSGAEALTVLEREDIDVLVSDIRMPGMNGIELMKKTNELQRDIRTLVLTGHGDFDNAVDALRLGADNYIKKPISAEFLHFAIMNSYEKKELKRKLRESEAQFRTMFEDNGAVMLLISPKTGSIVNANNASSDFYGYTVAELTSMKITDINILPEEHVHKEMQSVRVGEKKAFVFPHRLKNGEVRTVEVHSTTLNIKGQTLLFSIIHDIEEQEKLRIRLRQAQKMETIGTLAGGIAHDFNNILYPIIGYSEMTLDDLPRDSTARSNLEQVLKASFRAKELVKQILAFSRQGDSERIAVNLQHIIRESLQFLRATLPSTVEVRQHIDNTCRPVLADAGQIHQVMMNLCINAYQSMSEKGGTLEVRLKETAFVPQDSLGYPDMKPGTYLKLSISDTGHGMDSKVMERIFDPYFTTKEIGKGTGLGLSVVHGIVKSHKGHIAVYSEPDKGSVFHIYLPLIEDKADTKIISKEAIPGGKERILLADDEIQIIEMMTYVLENLGYTISARTSSLEALEIFSSSPQSFDLVITDMTMPNMTGLELSEELMRIRPDIPILLCTGFSERVTEEKIKEAGIRELLMKPAPVKEIADAVRRILD